MHSQKVDSKKRQLMRATLGVGLVGTALPSVWTKPIVNAVVLPAHAQMSIAAFTVEKSQSGGPDPATLEGDVLEYTIVVTNTGTIDLTDVVVTDTTPDGTVVVLTDPDESKTADGILEVEETWTYETTYTVTAEDIAAGTPLTNSVSVEVGELDDPEVDDVEIPVVPAMCPDLVIDNISFGEPSSVVANCGISFDILSSDPAVPLTVTSITSDVAAPNLVSDNGPGEVTATNPITVTWNGQVVGACGPDAVVVTDVAFIVEATCDAAPDDVVLEFNLSDLDGVTAV